MDQKEYQFEILHGLGSEAQSVGRTQKWGILHRKERQDGDKGRFLEWAVWCPAQKSGRDDLLEEANTPLALDPRGMFPFICESHQGCQESTDSFLSHCLNRKRKRLFSPLYLGEPTAECLRAQRKELSSLRQFSLGYVERTSVNQPVASLRFPSWLFCCWAFNVSPGKAFRDVSNMKCKLWKRR